jgi:hypothetical protein
MRAKPRSAKRREIRVELSLGEAWLLLADPWARATYRVAHGGLKFREALMKSDLISRLYEGTYDAIAYMTKPKISNERKTIPKHLFEDPQIDWKKSTLRAYGHVYEGIRVVAARYERPNANPTAARTVDPKSALLASHPEPAIKPQGRSRRDKLREPVVEENRFGPLSTTESAAVSKPKREAGGQRGRRPLVDKVQAVIRELMVDERLGEVSLKEQENRIRDLARKRYPNDFRKRSQPARNTIYKAMEAEGLRRRS